MKRINSSGESGAESSRKGIALVVVLGFLAILTLMAVGMAISMRTERLASSSYLDMVKARMYCQSGLADSMVWVEENLATTSESNKRFIFAPCFKETSDNTGGDQWSGFYWMLPSRDPVARPAGEYDEFRNSFFDGLGTNFLDYVPIRYQYELPSTKNDYNVSKMNVQWIHVTNDATGEVEGRYMYTIFDCSAFVDLNYLGREVVPGFRTGGYWDMIDDEDTFFSLRDTHSRYETEGDIHDSNSAARETDGPDWFHFSYSPPMKRVVVERDGDFNKVKYMNDLQGSSDPIYISTNINDWVQSDIEAAFRLGIRDFGQYANFLSGTTENPIDPAIAMYQLLHDYVDEDYKPQGGNLDRPSIEPVPMVNEVMVSSNIANVEVWMPFVGVAETNRFTSNFKIKVDADGETGSLYPAQLSDWPSNVRPPLPTNFVVQLSSEVSNATFDVEVILENNSGDELDKVEKETLSGVQPGKYWQCNDPRFNHLSSQWDKNSDTGTMNNINANANYAYRGNGETDGDYMMYCANRPLRSTGELGYLPLAPWRTIKLYEDHEDDADDMDPILDYFTMQTNASYGLLNPNAGDHYARTINSIFDTRNQVNGGYLGMYHTDTEQSDSHGSEFLSEFLHRNRIANDHTLSMAIRDWFRSFGQPSVNISDFGERLFRRRIIRKVLLNFKEASLNNEQYSELRIEHLMRRASALANVRQNLFLVCIWAQNMGDPTGGKTDWNTYPIKSEAQAVALVWRDPYPVSNENQYHRKFIRYMRWME